MLNQVMKLQRERIRRDREDQAERLRREQEQAELDKLKEEEEKLVSFSFMTHLSWVVWRKNCLTYNHDTTLRLVLNDFSALTKMNS